VAQISGTVKDSSAAVLPGVEIKVTQIETGVNRTTVTDETGSYALPNLTVGPYRFEASLPGFSTYAQTGIVLQVNSNPETSAVPARYGHHAAAAVNAVTKSGSNQIHGDAFWFVRNGVFNARNAFAPTRETLKRNQFGGTIGGPIKKYRMYFEAIKWALGLTTVDITPRPLAAITGAQK
jgi:carboxypeptidase family protein